MKKQQYCTACVISSAYKNIFFNEDGICNLCLDHKKEPQKVLGEKVLRAELKKQLDKNDDREYDCAVAFSGGKDSAYVLYLLKEKYKLKILAITGEDYISSDQAWQNRFNVVKKLGVDHLIIRYDWKLYREVYKAAILKSGMRPRAINLVHNLMHEKAIFEVLQKYKIPLLITGNSEDELDLFKEWEKNLGFKSTGNYAFDYWNNWREAYIKVLEEILPKNLQNKINDIVWKKPQKNDNACKNKHLPLFKYEKFDIDHNIKTIEEKLNWKMPTDVGGTETDSKGLQFCVQIYRKLHGDEEYRAQISKLVRSGTINRKIADKAASYKSNKVVKEFFEEFGISWKDLKPNQCSPFLNKWLNLFLPIR